MGVETIVLGLSASSADYATLNELAQLGGRPRATSQPYFYPIWSGDDLLPAITSIANEIVYCTFALPRAPARPDLLGVTASGGQSSVGPFRNHSDDDASVEWRTN